MNPYSAFALPDPIEHLPAYRAWKAREAPRVGFQAYAAGYRAYASVEQDHAQFPLSVVGLKPHSPNHTGLSGEDLGFFAFFAAGARLAQSHRLGATLDGYYACSCGRFSNPAHCGRESAEAWHDVHLRANSPNKAMKSVRSETRRAEVTGPFDEDYGCKHEHFSYDEARTCAGARGGNAISIPMRTDGLGGAQHATVLIPLDRYACCGTLASARHSRACPNRVDAYGAERFRESLFVRRPGEDVPFGFVAVTPEGPKERVPVQHFGASGIVPWTYCDRDEIVVATFAPRERPS